MSAELKMAVIELREDDALRITDELLGGGVSPLQVVSACKDAMDVIGQRFANGEAFIPELVMAGEIMQAITAKAKPRMAAQEASDSLGTVVLCTVEGDIHDIGKDIVATMLDIGGFDVIDLGVDAPVQTVVDKIREVKPEVLGLSGLLTIAFESMRATVSAIDEAGLHNGLKIMLGGAPINEDVRVYAGADGWAKDAVGAVDLAKTWVGGA